MPCAGNTQGDCYAAVWAQRVVNNGGARPSQTTIDAAATFHNALRTAGILSKIKILNFIAPDSLTAALTPFIKGVGVDPWNNNGPFVSGDLTVNGLAGNATTKYLDLGAPATQAAIYSSDTSAGFTFYLMTAPAALASASAGKNNANTTEGGIFYNATQMNWDCWDTALGRLTVNHQNQGYYSGNRTAANSSNIYYAKGGTSHASIGSIATTGGSRPNITPFIFAFTEFNGSPIFLSADRFSFFAWHDGLSAAESLALYNAVVALRTSLGGGFVPDSNDAQQMAVDWAARVVANGGALPSASSISAAQTFYQALIDASIHTKMKALNFYAPDGFIAARTPLIVGVGSDPWDHFNMSVADLSVNGLKGGVPALQKVIRTGVYMPELTASDYGFTVYVSENPSALTEVEMGVSNSLVDFFHLAADFSGSAYWQASYTGGAGTVTAANAGWTGYISGNRIANNDSRIFKANSGTAHAQLGATNTTVIADNRAAMGAIEIWVHCLNNAAVNQNNSQKRLSFVAIHDGLTQVQSADFYNAVQALRTALGGGYV